MGVKTNWWIVGFVVLCVLVGTIYVGGAVPVKGAPVFVHIDYRLGTRAFMNLHYGLLGVLRMKRQSSGEDPFTKVYHDWDKVLKNTSE